MASLSLKHIYKVYDNGANGVKAVNDFCMEIEDKEFIVFVGPSGCGKSTTLRMIAGLEEITAGELMIGDEVVNDVEPKERNIAMVFQNYALYPHMTVRENMAFALELSKKFTKEEINDRVNEAARILDIEQFLDRKPRALSGGQRQRVSLGRAIVRDPKVFLLDEPLSNLDAKLRAQMRTEISKLHNKLQTTFIYVTHDQVEAMTMGTRIVVMKLGVVQQIDTPKNLYKYPANKFVAGFIGTPQMNFFDATLKKTEGGKVEVTFANNRKILLDEDVVAKTDGKYLDGNTTVTLGVRPEDVHWDEKFVSEHKKTAFTCRTSLIEALGSETIVYCELDEENDAIGDSSTRLTLKVDPKAEIDKNQDITVAIDPQCIHLFDNETEMTIMPRIPQYNLVKAKVKSGKVDLLGADIALPSAIDLPDGDYILNIPSDAFIFKGFETPLTPVEESHKLCSVEPVGEKYANKALKNLVKTYPCEQFEQYELQFNKAFDAEIESVEDIGKTRLLRLKVNKNKLFAIGNGVDNVKTLSVAVDWKKVTFTGEEKVTEAFALTNTLSARVVKEQTGKKKYNFALEVAGAEIYLTDYIATKIFNALGRKAFETELTVDFGIYDVMTADSGIEGVVEKILDYGTEKIAVVKAGEAQVNVYLGNSGVKQGDNVKLALNLPRLGVVETLRGIRII